MSGSLNKVMLIGRLGQDPEVRSTQDGRSLCTFSIATSESWNDKNTGEKRKKPNGIVLLFSMRALLILFNNM